MPVAASRHADREWSADLYRVAAIVVVVLGHWLLAAVTFHDGRFGYDEVLVALPGTQWLTWFFQVVPVFFVVAGYANAASWRRRTGEYDQWPTWYRRRATQVLGPTSAYVLSIAVVVGLLLVAGVDGALLVMPTWVLSMHLWFLAIYLVVVSATPLAVWAQERWGLRVLAGMAVAVATVDGVSLGADVPAFGWANYALCWGAIYQFGVAWQSGDLRGRRPMLIASGATLVLAAMIGLRLYPVSMIGVPGQPVQNTSPPTLALLALACVQAGLLVALAPGVTTRLRTARHRGLLEVANRNSFGLYLWHMFPVVLVALAVYPSAMFPQPELGSASWWLWRCAWVAVLSVVTVVELTLLRWTRAVFARPVPTVRTGMRDGLSGPALTAGTIAVAATLSRIAADGFVPAGHPSVAWVAAYVAGVAMVALRPAGVATRHRRARSATSPSEGRAVGRNRTRRAPNREGKQRIS